MGVRVRRSGDEVELQLTGDVDMRNADEPYEVLAAELARSTPVRKVAVDLTDVQFIDSRGLGGLIRAKQEADACDVPFRLRHLTPQVATVLSMTGLDQEFVVERD